MNIHPEIKLNRGRPSKYSNKVIKINKEYLVECAKNNSTPFIEELAIKLGVSDGTLWNWSNTHENFNEVYEMLLTFQKLDRKRKALSGQYVSKIASLLLSNDHNVSLKRKMELEAKITEKKEINLTPDQRKLYSEAITKVFEQIYSQPSITLS